KRRHIERCIQILSKLLLAVALLKRPATSTDAIAELIAGLERLISSHRDDEETSGQLPSAPKSLIALRAVLDDIQYEAEVHNVRRTRRTLRLEIRVPSVSLDSM